MKIAFVITRSDAVGGAHIHVRDLAEALLVQGHQAIVALGGGKGHFTDDLDERKIPWADIAALQRSINPLADIRAYLGLKRFMLEWQPDLVSTHSSKAGILGRLAARRAGIPAIFTAHGWSFTEGVSRSSRRLYERIERFAAPLSKRIITVSEFDYQLALTKGVADQSRMVCVHNGMPLLKDVASARPERQPPQLIMVARFEEQKNHGLLIRALAPLKHLPWTLSLVGGGPLENEIRELVAQLGLHDRVAFLGARRDVPQLLKDSQLFVLSSNWEGFPRSILEAMRAGLPVVATNVAGTSESVVGGVTGLLVPKGNEAALTSALKAYIESPDLRSAAGGAGRERYLQNFTFDHMFQKTLAVYREALGQNT